MMKKKKKKNDHCQHDQLHLHLNHPRHHLVHLQQRRATANPAAEGDGRRGGGNQGSESKGKNDLGSI